MLSNKGQVTYLVIFLPDTEAKHERLGPFAAGVEPDTCVKGRKQWLKFLALRVESSAAS
jgi:hypothetical protein